MRKIINYALSDLLGLEPPDLETDADVEDETPKKPETPEQRKQREYEALQAKLKEIPKEDKRAVPSLVILLSSII